LADVELKNEEEIEMFSMMVAEQLKTSKLAIPQLPVANIRRNMKNLSKGSFATIEKELKKKDNFI
jgi:hypothetical protein